MEGSGTKEQGSAWALSLACCVSLLRPTHPRRRFNHYQFARVDLLRHLLVACKVTVSKNKIWNVLPRISKFDLGIPASIMVLFIINYLYVCFVVQERFLNSECLPLSAATSNNLVELVRGLVGSPPLLHHIALLTDFLLLMHQVIVIQTLKLTNDVNRWSVMHKALF